MATDVLAGLPADVTFMTAADLSKNLAAAYEAAYGEPIPADFSTVDVDVQFKTKQSPWLQGVPASRTVDLAADDHQPNTSWNFLSTDVMGKPGFFIQLTGTSFFLTASADAQELFLDSQTTPFLLVQQKGIVGVSLYAADDVAGGRFAHPVDGTPGIVELVEEPAVEDKCFVNIWPPKQ